MKKKVATDSSLGAPNDMKKDAGTNISEAEFPSPLIYKLSEFYRRWPDYPTGIVDIVILSRILHVELDKFLHRPHKQVTQIYFDSETVEMRRE